MGKGGGENVCDAMADQEILFFGSVMVMLAGVRVNDPALLLNARRGGGVTFCVRATVVPAREADAAELMGECVDSSWHPLQDAAMAEELLVPVLLERAPPASVPGRGGSDVVGARLVLEVSVACGGMRSDVARHVVFIQSLHDIASKNCGVVIVRVAAASLCCSEAWRQGAELAGGDESCSAAELSDNRGGEWSGVKLQFVVRALDMSEPVRLMLAAQDEAGVLLRLPPQNLRAAFVLSVQLLPYGVLPLDALYYHYCRFFEHLFNKTLKPSKYVAGLLSEAGMDGAGFRWCALDTVDMRPVLLGDNGLAPLLATLYHCPSLTSLVLDQNSAGDLTCYRLAALFHGHRHFRELSICRNEIHECGAEQLLRLARRNKGLTRLDASGNPCSSRIAERIWRVAGLNEQALANDFYNLLSHAYDYALSPTSISPIIVKKALVVWSMLSIAPVRIAECTTDDTDCSLIPQCALAPLLNEVMRTVALRMSRIVRNPLALGVFSDIESHWKAASSERKESREPVLQEGDWDYGGKGVDMTELENVRDVGQEGKVNGSLFVDVEELYRLSFVRAIVVTMRSFMQETHWVETTAVLRKIGKLQRAAGVMPGDYRDALEVFVQSLTIVCGSGHVDADNSAAFLQCLATGMRVVIAA